jgi:hypothetical protein
MPNMGYFKGQTCMLKPILCQEGFCSNCFIYLEKPQIIMSSIKGTVSHLTHVLGNVLTIENPQNTTASSKQNL